MIPKTQKNPRNFPGFSLASIYQKGGEKPLPEAGIEIVPDMVRIFRGVSGTVSALLI